MRADGLGDSELIQRKGDPATTFVEKGELHPKRDGILYQPHSQLFISAFGEGPFQSGTHIFDISPVDKTPLPRRLSIPVSDGLLTDSLEIGSMTSSRQLRLAPMRKFLQRIESNGFEKAIARHRAGHIQMKKRFAHKVSEQVNDVPLILNLRTGNTMRRLD